MDDKFIVGQIINGNQAAFKILVLRHQKAIFRFITLFGCPLEIVEELAQETFLLTYKNLEHFDYISKRSSFKSWIFTIAKNLSINHKALKYKKQELQIANEIDLKTGGENQVTEKLEERELATYIREKIEVLPVMFKIPLVLFYFDGLSLEEVAIIESCPVNTIKTRIHRAKLKLKELISMETIS